MCLLISNQTDIKDHANPGMMMMMMMMITIIIIINNNNNNNNNELYSTVSTGYPNTL